MQSNAWAVKTAFVGVFGALACPAHLAAQGASPSDQGQSAGQIPASLGVSFQDLDHGTWMGTDHRGIHAHGADYKSVFNRSGLVFTPALGRAVPVNQDFALRAVDASRGGPPMAFVTPEPRREGDHVLFDHPNAVERFSIRPEGIEHSYVFQALPKGRGDLVIRHRIETPLAANNLGGNQGVRFQVEGAGGVDVGGVTGIDAEGRRFTGSVNFVDGILEYRLPAEQVAAAALPLTVDPFLTPFNVIVAGNDDQTGDIAFDDSTNRWGVCWQRNFSNADSEIRARILSSNGTSVVTSLLVLTSDTLSQISPRIANINQSDAFVVVWTEFTSLSIPLDFDVRARAFTAAGVLGANTVTVQGGVGLQQTPDIAGDQSTVDNDAIVVYQDSTGNGDIWAEQLQCSTTAQLTPFANRVNISAGGTFNDGSPAITQSSGATNRAMIVWSRSGFGGTTNSAIRGAVVDRNLTVLDNFASITSTARDYDDPAVDGDGDLFVIAYERNEDTTTTAGDNDIGVTTWIWDPASSQVESLVPDTVLGSTPNDDETNPSVAYLGGEVLVALEDEDPATTTDYDIRYFAVDPFTCLSCETTNAVAASSSTVKERFPVVVARRSSGDSSDQAMLIYNTEDTGITDNGNLTGRIFDPADGFLQDLGGGCGNAGQLRVGCARSPNANGQISLTSATPGAAAWIVLSRETRNIPCGSCTLIPDPYTGWIASATVASNGTAGFSVNVPASLAGQRVIGQWLVFDASATCSIFGTNLTSAVQITLQ